MALKLLVVDDSASTRRMVVRTLNVAGLPPRAMHEAGDGNEALATLEMERALLYLDMPGMHGKTAPAHTRGNAQTRPLPVAALSTECRLARVRDQADPAARRLRKLFAPEALISVVADALEAVNDA
jgi:two-component system, chemotaxis family, chemotaxis protein CheY